MYSEALTCSPRPLLRQKITFVEGVETDHLYLEIPIKGHLPVDILAKGSLTSSRAPSYPNNDPRDRFLDDTILPNFEEVLHISI